MYNTEMRTTIDLPEDLRAKLISLAAQRGMKGFSGILAEALRHYFELGKFSEARHRVALATKGTLSEKESKDLAQSCREIREKWRS